jgi:hypothetical protein
MGEIILNTREIIYLVNILNTEKFVGLEDLIKNRGNIESIFEEAKTTLNVKKYITINEKKQISIDIGVYILLNTCSTPETYVSYKKVDKKMGLVKCNYYSYNSVCVRMIEMINSGQYIFQFVS